MRSKSRFLHEDKQKFLTQLRANGMPAATVEQINNLGKTVLYLPITTDAAEKALQNKTGLESFVDARGVKQLAAYGPVEVGCPAG